jgi:HEAT repeat protein
MRRWLRTIRWKRLLRFRLRTLLVLVAFAAVLFAWWSDRRRLAERIARRDDLLSALRAPDDREDDAWQEPVRSEELVVFQTVERLLQSLRDDQDWVAAGGKHAKPLFRPESVGREAVPRLLPLLKDGDPKVRSRVAYVLRCVGHLSPDTAAPLLEAARDGSDEVRFEAIWALHEVDGPVSGLAGALASCLNGDRPREFEGLIATIRKHSSASDVNPRLLELLTHANAETRATAVKHLELAPSSPREYVAAVMAMLGDSDPGCRAAAAAALGALSETDPPVQRDMPVADVVDRLVKAFKVEEEPNVRSLMAQSIQRLHRNSGE